MCFRSTLLFLAALMSGSTFAATDDCQKVLALVTREPNRAIGILRSWPFKTSVLSEMTGIPEMELNGSRNADAHQKLLALDFITKLQEMSPEDLVNYGLLLDDKANSASPIVIARLRKKFQAYAEIDVTARINSLQQRNPKIRDLESFYWVLVSHGFTPQEIANKAGLPYDIFERARKLKKLPAHTVLAMEDLYSNIKEDHARPVPPKGKSKLPAPLKIKSKPKTPPKPTVRSPLFHYDVVKHKVASPEVNESRSFALEDAKRRIPLVAEQLTNPETLVDIMRSAPRTWPTNFLWPKNFPAKAANAWILKSEPIASTDLNLIIETFANLDHNTQQRLLNNYLHWKQFAGEQIDPNISLSKNLSIESKKVIKDFIEKSPKKENKNYHLRSVLKEILQNFSLAELSNSLGNKTDRFVLWRDGKIEIPEQYGLAFIKIHEAITTKDKAALMRLTLISAERAEEILR